MKKITKEEESHIFKANTFKLREYDPKTGTCSPYYYIFWWIDEKAQTLTVWEKDLEKKSIKLKVSPECDYVYKVQKTQIKVHSIANFNDTLLDDLFRCCSRNIFKKVLNK